MIQDIPTQEDFDAVGATLLDQAWDMATSLLLALDDARQWVDEPDVEDFWRSAHVKMATALSIAHQGAEFLIKGRIVSVSPYLLIANAPREWPKADSNGNVSFSKFRTIDAQDLIRLHDSAAMHPLSEDFSLTFELLRVRRNSIMHTVDRHLKVQVSDLVESILKIHKSLMPTQSWIKVRKEALYESSIARLYSGEWVDAQVVREFNAIKDVVTPAVMRENFAFDKKKRVYLCPSCTWSTCAEIDFEARTAQLSPNTPSSEEVYCFVCEERNTVSRTPCADVDCKGNVASMEWDKCLTCGTHTPTADTQV